MYGLVISTQTEVKPTVFFSEHFMESKAQMGV